MAKSKGFFGLRTGSTKSLTFSVLKGEQITKDRVSIVNNPRSTGQMVQRLSFAAASLFYKHANRNFFKFAFEDKKRNESEFNAFMRHNVVRAGADTKKMLQLDYPAVGNWMVTNGRLGTYQPSFYDDGGDGYLALGIPATKSGAGNPTIGEVSKALLAENSNLQENDIVTITRIYSSQCDVNVEYSVCVEEQSLVTVTGNNPFPVWDIKQFRIDSQSSVVCDYLNVADDGLYIENPAGIVPTSNTLYMACFTISRVSDGQTIVSTSILGGTSSVQDCIAISTSDDWKVWAANNYKANKNTQYADAILKGSLLAEAVLAEPEILSTRGFAASLADAQSKAPMTPPNVSGSPVVGTNYMVLEGENLENIKATKFTLTINNGGASIPVSWDASANALSFTLTEESDATLSYNGLVLGLLEF